jgi:hypothetical protein
MSIYAQVPDNSEIEIAEKTEYVFNTSGNKVLSETQFKHVWISVNE